jgi:peptidoglycan L-alanyl-D-glutamate endopeptidase CwlK
MNNFTPISKDRLNGCHPDLQILFEHVNENYPCTILVGVRGQADQDAAVAAGKSKDPWPTSKHNQVPSLAVDAAPLPLDWVDIRRFYHFAGYVLAVAESLGIKVRYGGDWKGDRLMNPPHTLNDLDHWELIVDNPVQT